MKGHITIIIEDIITEANLEVKTILFIEISIKAPKNNERIISILQFYFKIIFIENAIHLIIYNLS